DAAAGGGVEADEVAHRPEGVHLAAGDDRRRPRAGGEGEDVIDVVLVLPHHLAGGVVQAQHPLGAGDPAAGHAVGGDGVAGPGGEVGDVDAVAGHGRAGVPG